jgi:hypothetical protein
MTREPSDAVSSLVHVVLPDGRSIVDVNCESSDTRALASLSAALSAISTELLVVRSRHLKLAVRIAGAGRDIARSLI